MSSVGLSGMSGISSDALQTRYQKSLKQINKLIQINRQLKESSNNHQSQIQNLKTQVQKMQQANRELDDQNNILQSKYMELQNHYRDLESYCKELEHKLENNHMDSEKINEKLEENRQKYQQQLDGEIVKYNELAREAEIIFQVYQESITTMQTQDQKCKGLEKENEQLRLKIHQLQESNGKLSAEVKENHIDVLKNKLQQANNTIQKLFKQCNKLKSKQIDFQVQQQKQKVQKFIGFSTANDPRQNQAVKDLINEYKKRIKNLENERKQYEKKYKTLKAKTSKSVNQQIFLSKIEKLERFTQKQQSEIKKIIEMYDKQISLIYRQNKQLKDINFSLSQRLSKNIMDLSQKQKCISQLKMGTERASFEIQSLKRVNTNLIQSKTQKFKQLSSIQKDVTHSDSFTSQVKKDLAEQLNKQKFAKNITIQSQELLGHPMSVFRVEPQKQRIRYQTIVPPKQNIPITVNYRSPGADPGDFNFIQSVNIINGYNVSLGDNAPQRAKK